MKEMQMEKLDWGDLVMLRSGGPVMTVFDVCDSETCTGPLEVLCGWFDCEGHVQHCKFPLPVVRKITDGNFVPDVWRSPW
jgi:uncharacterized protein YodC (DUF2158 family)